MGKLREQEGLPYEAEQFYEQAAPRHPEAAWALVELLGEEASEAQRRQADDAAYIEGCRLAQQNRDMEAETWLRRAAEHHHPGAMWELSVILDRRGKKAESRSLRRAVDDEGQG